MSLRGRRAPRRGLALILLFLLASCGGERPSGGGQTDDWRLLQVGTLFTIRVPREIVYKPDATFVDAKGILSSDRMQIHLGYGPESFAPPVFEDRQVKVEATEIGERRATLTWYEQNHVSQSGGASAPYVIHAVFDDDGKGGSRLSFAAFCTTSADRAIAERIIRSVRFLPRRPA
jgi:hypothetical protein